VSIYKPVRDARLSVMAERGLFGCVWCSRGLSERSTTVDHFMPVSLGGPNIAANLLPSCRKCNAARGNMGPTRWAHHCVMSGQRVQVGAILDFVDSSLDEVGGISEYEAFHKYLADKKRGMSALRRVLRVDRWRELHDFTKKKNDKTYAARDAA
jgi:hypothetical protein